MIELVICTVTLALLGCVFFVARSIIANRELDADMQAAAFKEIRELAESAMTQLAARTPMEAVEAKAREVQLDLSNEAMADEYARAVGEEQRVKPRMVKTANGGEIDLNDYYLE